MLFTILLEIEERLSRRNTIVNTRYILRKEFMRKREVGSPVEISHTGSNKDGNSEFCKTLDFPRDEISGQLFPPRCLTFKIRQLAPSPKDWNKFGTSRSRVGNSGSNNGNTGDNVVDDDEEAIVGKIEQTNFSLREKWIEIILGRR